MEETEFLALARKRFEDVAEDEKNLRERFVADLKFASPDGEGQWDPQVKQQREAAGRPAMSFPRCHTFVQQVANDARQNKPQIKFSPRLDADKDTADVYEGLARYIQYTSDAQVAYETAVEYSAGGSFGYYRFLTDYVEDDSDDLELKIVPVLDPLTVYGILVPAIFGRNPKFWFVVEDIPKEEYKNEYPDSEISTMDWADAEKHGEGWVGSEAVRIAEYWWVEEKKEKGKRRPKVTIKTCKINGSEILPDTETEWPGTLCNVIPVLGKQMIIEGKPQLSSVVTPQRSAQQLINYSKSRIAETLSTSPISPFMVAEGQISGYEKEWSTLNSVNRPFLTYKMVDVAGRPIPAPQRQTFEPPIQALSSFVLQEIDDMKATTGIFDASLGSSPTEVSGQAIKARQQQSNLSTMHFMDNLVRSFKKGGLVIAELIPKIYDSAREIQILGEDEEAKVIKINQDYQDPKGNTKNHDMTKGRYEPIVTSGKAFDSKRMETFDTMQQLVQSAPNLLPMFGDILFKNSDLAGADQLADRFKKMLPPNLQDDTAEPVPPQAQAQIAQLTQHLQGINAAAQEYEKQIQQLQFEKQSKMVEQQGKLKQIQVQAQADMALEDKKLLTAITVADINTKAQMASDRESDRRELIAQFHDQAHDVAMQAQGAQQAQQAQAQAAATQSQQSAQDAGQQQEAAVHQAALQPEAE